MQYIINMKALKYLTLIFLLISCQPQEEEEEGPKKIYVGCTQIKQDRGECQRFMDRNIYFARQSPTDSLRNNVFHVDEVKNALSEVAAMTNLGDNYFQYHEVEESELQLVLEQTSGITFKSFIQIWPDLDFNQLFTDLSVAVDNNAILVINSANKHQFFLVLRASCFEASSANCTNSLSAIFTSNMGLRALVARQLSRLVGVQVKDCVVFPNHPMCSSLPHDGQWSIDNQNLYKGIMNNALESVENSPNFYEEFFLEE